MLSSSPRMWRRCSDRRTPWRSSPQSSSRELELRVLEIEDALAEGAALLDVGEQSVRPRGRTPCGSACQSSGRSPGLRRRRAARRPAASCRRRTAPRCRPQSLHVLLELLAAPGSPATGGCRPGTARRPWRRGSVGLGRDDDEVGVLAVGDEGLRAVHHPAVPTFSDRVLIAWRSEPVPGSVMASAPTMSPAASFGR